MGKAGIIALGCALAVLALGCGERTEKAEPSTEAAQPTAPTDAQKARKKTRAELLAEQPAEITKGELPKFYPSDLPMFPDSKPLNSMMVGGSGLLVLSTPAAPAEVLAHYREQLPAQGWTVDNVFEKPRASRIAAHKEGRKATISITRGKDGAETEIGVALSGS